jgi:hypothetical protein
MAQCRCHADCLTLLLVCMHFATRRPLSSVRTGDRSQMKEKVRRAPPGCRLHSSSHRRRGSIGMTRSMRYTLVPRSAASASSAVPGLHRGVSTSDVLRFEVHAGALQRRLGIQRRPRPAPQCCKFLRLWWQMF